MNIKWNRFGLSVASLLLLGLLTPVLAVAQGQGTNHAPVTFTKDVMPILQRACQTCHRPESVAPMSLMTYEEARPWARSIRQKVSAREMPPWFIEKDLGIQKFKDDPSLTDAEIATIVKWVDGGAPQGNRADMPPPRHFPDAAQWTIGTPDLIIPSPVVTIRATAPDWHTSLPAVESGLTEDRYIKAIEIKPTLESRKVVHHAQVSMARTAASDGEIRDAEASIDGDNRLSLYELNRNAEVYPDNSGKLMKAGTKLTFSMHYHSIGKEVQARFDVGITFYPKGVVPKYIVDFTYAGNFWEVDVPAGETVRADGYFIMPKAGIVGSFEPHMHTRGVRMCMEAIHTNGRIETLNCAKYNHNWVRIYTYDSAVAPLLPKGTIIHSIGWYDNSANNKNNMDSRNWAGFGNRTVDDMDINFVNMVWLTDEQYQEELAARKAKPRATHNQE